MKSKLSHILFVASLCLAVLISCSAPEPPLPTASPTSASTPTPTPLPAPSPAPTASPLPSPTSPSGPAIPDAVQEHIQELVDNDYSRGIVVALIDANGTTFSSYGKMSQNGGPVDEHTIYEIGSISKVFTAILLADMAERGEAALDAPLEKYLPAEVQIPERTGKIALELLATHRSGLPALPTNLDPLNPNPYAGYTAEDLYAFLSNYTLPRDPNTQYEYSNLGAGLLGHILARVADTSYEQLVIDRISRPLGLDDTRITLSDEQRSRFAQGHLNGGRETNNWDFDCLAGCGALRSSAADVARFVAANMGLYKTDLYPAMQRTHQARADTGQANMQIGLGWHIITAYDTTITWHNGSTGGYHSFCGFVPSKNIGVVVLSNSNYDIDGIGFHLLEPQVELPQVRKVALVEAKVLETYAGTYELAPGVLLTVTVESGTLMAQVTGQPALAIYPESETAFFYRVVDAQISFQKDDGGKVVALVLSQGGTNYTAKKVK